MNERGRVTNDNISRSFERQIRLLRTSGSVMTDEDVALNRTIRRRPTEKETLSEGGRRPADILVYILQVDAPVH